MRIQAVLELMFAKICHWIRHGGRAQQRNSHYIVMDVMSIFAVVQETDTVVAFTQIHPFVRASLEACPVPAGVAMGGTLHVSPLDFIGCLRCKNIYRESDFEHDMALIPFNVSVKI